MTKKRALTSLGIFFLAFFLAALFILPIRQKIQFFFGNIISRGAVSRDQALTTQCAEKNTICTVKDGRIEQKKLTEKDREQMEKQFTTTRERNIHYADNVAAAVFAIRKYTGVGNLDLHRLNESTPTNVSYYCTRDESKCWAVDNTTHQVLPNLKL